MRIRKFKCLCLKLAVAELGLVMLAGCGSSQASESGPSNSPNPSGGSPAKTTLQAETSNNTSASNSFTAQLNGLPAPGNVSKVDTHTLLYSGSTTKIFAAMQGWFGEAGHMNVGYQSNDPQQVSRQIVDMQSRGIQGAILDWYGQFGDVLTNETAIVLQSQAEAHPGFEFAIMEDGGALFNAAKANGCNVTAQLITDLQYISSQFVPSSAYMRVNGRPVIFFFGVDAYYIDWDQVQSQVPNNPIFLFQGSPGYTHPLSGGAFQWIDIPTANAFTPTSPNPFDPQVSQQAAFYETNPNGLYTVGSTYRGFHDGLAPWGIDRIVQPLCGQTWLATFAEIGKFYSSTNQLPAMQIVTWNDYDEGSAVEMGIDNCVFLQPSVSGNTLNWSVGGGAESTIDHYTVYSSQDGQNLTKLADVPAGIHSFSLGSLSSSILFVKATGRPTLQNKMSPPIAYRPGHQPPVVKLALTAPSALTVTASTAGSTDPDGQIASSTINFGDGTVVNGPSATHTYATVGSYNVTATVVDNTGASAVSVEPFSAKATAPGVTIFSPQPNGVVNWPQPSFTASAVGANPITQMSVLLDGTQLYATNLDTLNTALKIYTGNNRQLQVTATDTAGNVSQSAVSISAQPGDPAPVPVTQSTPLPQEGANTVLFCGANWQAPNRFVNAYQWTFSDGSPMQFTPGVVHTFPSPGTYSVTQFVINEFGTPGTVTQSVNVTDSGSQAAAHKEFHYRQDERTQKRNVPTRLPSSAMPSR